MSNRFDPKHPKFVVYILNTFGNDGYDSFLNKIIPKFNDIGINVIILSFLFFDNADLTKPNLDVAISEWCEFTSDQRKQLKEAFNGVILVSHGGSAGTGYLKDYHSYGFDSVAQASWNFVKNNDLDGIDVDYEHGATCDDTMTLTKSLADQKPANVFLTMAPEMSDCTENQSCWICHHNIYCACADKIDWLHLQYYNQVSDFVTSYTYLMIDSTSADSYQISIKEIITGKKDRKNSLISNVHCAYNYLSPPQPLPCPDITPIPSYKVVLGSCSGAPDGCNGSLTPTIASDFIKEASTDPNFVKDWFTGGGLMVWLYKNNESIDYSYNEEIFKAVTAIRPLFNTSSSTTPNESPVTPNESPVTPNESPVTPNKSPVTRFKKIKLWIIIATIIFIIVIVAIIVIYHLLHKKSS